MIYLKSFKEMEGKTVLSVKTSRTNDIPGKFEATTEYTLIKLSGDTCILYRDDLDYDPIYGVVDDTDVNINYKVRTELGLQEPPKERI